MTRARPGLCCATLAALLSGAPARADPHPVATPVQSSGLPLLAVRAGQHLGFLRLVFDLPPGVVASLTARPDGALVRLPGAWLAPLGLPPAGLVGWQVQADGLTLSWLPGATLRRMRFGDRLVLDLLRHSAASASSPAAATPLPTRAIAAPTLAVIPRPEPRPGHARLVAATHPPLRPSPPPVAAQPLPPLPAAVPLPVAPPPPVAQPPSLPVAAPRPPAAGGPIAVAAQPVGAGAVLPFAADTGAAAFRRGGWGVVVFDEARPIDLAALAGQPAFATARLHVLEAATVLRIRLAPAQALALARRPEGWSVGVVPAPPPLHAIRPLAADGRLDLDLDRPGRAVTIPDPDTGGVLLVGTLRGRGPNAASPIDGSLDDGPAGIAVERRAPAFDLLASWQGVAVAPVEDSVSLRAGRAGFVLEQAGGREDLALATAHLSVQPDAEAGRFARRFDWPDLPLPALDRRLRLATAAAALAPAEDRGPARLQAAEAMLALGMDAEAEALVRLAVTEDPRLLRDPQAIALGGAAALLAGRMRAAEALAGPALSTPGQPGADETALWRALLAAARADPSERPDPAAAQVLAADLPLLLSYPAPLRHRLLPLALDTVARGGEAAAAQAVADARPHDATLEYARALLAQQAGRADDALVWLDRLAAAADRDVAARAAVRAVALRLDLGRLSPRQAADALDPLIYVWRGDEREAAVRLREAALRMQAGQPRAALALLRESTGPVLAQGWPGQLPAIRQAMAEDFAAVTAGDAGHPLSPLDFLAFVQENPDLIPEGAAGQALAERVADRLAALDLPEQAAAALGRVMARMPPGSARAAIGGRLAALDLEQNDPQAALMALSASTADGLPPPLLERRTLVFARATAQRGDLDAATGALEALGTPAADALRASLLEAAGQWPQATAALLRVAGRDVPAAGPLDGAQTALLLRLASAAGQAGDTEVLASLRATSLPRVAPGHAADLLRVLTEGPVQTVTDLPRAEAETTLARTALK